MESSGGEKVEDVETVVLTGGSSGIGECLIHQLGSLDKRLLICNISRKKPAIDSPGLSILHIPCDLGKRSQLEGAAGEVIERLRERTGKILLVNNSGFGGYGPFPVPGLEHNLDMIEVNVKAAVHLTGLLLPLLRERGGAIVNIASTAAYQPTPYMATYGATKAFLLHWSLALGEELRHSGVHVLAVCPGPTKTPFFRRAGFDEPVLSPRLGQSVEEVVSATLVALRRKKRLVVSGRVNKILVAVSSRFPKPLAARVGEMILRRYNTGKNDAK